MKYIYIVSLLSSTGHHSPIAAFTTVEEARRGAKYMEEKSEYRFRYAWRMLDVFETLEAAKSATSEDT